MTIHARGFTLMELMVAMAMAVAIGTAAVMGGVQIQRSMAATRQHVVVWDEAKRVEEALLTVLQESGGSPLTPAQAIEVEQNTCPTNGVIPACNGQDRVTVTNVQRTFQEPPACTFCPQKPLIALTPCTVMGNTGAVLQIATDTAGLCSCLFPGNPAALPPTPAGTGAGDDERSPYERRKALLVRSDGSAVVELSLQETRAGCRVNVPPGFGNPTPPVLATFLPGTLVPVTRHVYFTAADPATPGGLQIQVWRDGRQGLDPPNDTPEANEIELFADRVYAFQIARGLDYGADGTVNDTNSTGDDWFGNAVGDPDPPDTDDHLLRMLGVGIIVGARSDRFSNQTRRIYDSALVNVPGVYLVETQSKVALRNLNISIP